MLEGSTLNHLKIGVVEDTDKSDDHAGNLAESKIFLKHGDTQNENCHSLQIGDNRISDNDGSGNAGMNNTKKDSNVRGEVRRVTTKSEILTPTEAMQV